MRNTITEKTEAWTSQLMMWEEEVEQMKDLLEKVRPTQREVATSVQEDDARVDPEHNTAKVKFRRAEKPTRFLIEEGRYEAICTNVRDPQWSFGSKWQVRIEFAICGKTTPPLVQFVTCGKDKAGPARQVLSEPRRAGPSRRRCSCSRSFIAPPFKRPPPISNSAKCGRSGCR